MGSFKKIKFRNYFTNTHLTEDSVLYLVKKAIEKANIDNKSVENCVCVLRNLSYRAQEVDDPNYDKVSNISERSVTD